MCEVYSDIARDMVCFHGKGLASASYRFRNRIHTISPKHHRLSCSRLHSHDARADYPSVPTLALNFLNLTAHLVELALDCLLVQVSDTNLTQTAELLIINTLLTLMPMRKHYLLTQSLHRRSSQNLSMRATILRLSNISSGILLHD